MVTPMSCGPCSGVRLVPCAGVNVQVPHGGYSVICHWRLDCGCPIFCMVNQVVCVDPGLILLNCIMPVAVRSGVGIACVVNDQVWLVVVLPVVSVAFIFQ